MNREEDQMRKNVFRYWLGLVALVTLGCAAPLEPCYTTSMPMVAEASGDSVGVIAVEYCQTTVQWY